MSTKNKNYLLTKGIKYAILISVTITIIEIKKSNHKGENTMKKWVCTVCGYVHEGETAPEKCRYVMHRLPSSRSRQAL